MAGKWMSLTNQPTFNTSTMLLLTDGRVMVQESGTQHWHALSPDKYGSYANGTWTTLADMSIWRQYYASGVLKDGRVFVCGGEDSSDIGDTNKGEIYDPVNDSWTSIPLPPWSNVGDASSCVLPDGRVIIGALTSGDCLIYDPVANSWTATGAQPGRTNEESWILLPDNTILTIQCFPPYGGQKYVISSGTWKDEGTPPVTVIDPLMSEIGPAMLLYNGKVIFFGAANSNGHGKTVIYSLPGSPTGTGTWVAGPDTPNVGGNVLVSNDCPASLLPNGKVLYTAANYVVNGWGTPVLFFEYDPATNTTTQAPTPINNNNIVYTSRMMLLPTGEVLFSPSSSNVQIYAPDGGPQEGWRPTISSVTQYGLPFLGHYLIQGTQLNGLSQANIYGDDCYPATNYPIVRLTQPTTDEVYYCRTHDFSTMAVATGPALQSAQFDPTGVPNGTYYLQVIANGIPSHVYTFDLNRTKLRWADSGVKREFEWFGKLVAEGDPFNWIEQVVDPELNELRMQLKYLQNGVQRLNSVIQAANLPRVGNEVTKEAKTNEEARKAGAAGKAKAARRPKDK